MSGQFTIRYRRAHRGAIALLVEDEAGVAYLFSDGVLQARTAGEGAVERLARLLGGSHRWEPVPAVAPYTLDGLRRLCGGEAIATEAPPGAVHALGRS